MNFSDITEHNYWARNWLSLKLRNAPHFRFQPVMAEGRDRRTYILLELNFVGENKLETQRLSSLYGLQPLRVYKGMETTWRHVLKGTKSEWRFYVSPDLTPDNQPELWI